MGHCYWSEGSYIVVFLTIEKHCYIALYLVIIMFENEIKNIFRLFYITLAFQNSHIDCTFEPMT